MKDILTSLVNSCMCTTQITEGDFLFNFSQSHVSVDNDGDNVANCKSVLCLSVRGLFSSDSLPEMVQLLSQYLVIHV